MITARIDTGQGDFFVRDRVRVVASFEDGRDLVILGKTADGHEYQHRPSRAPGVEGTVGELPEGVSLYTLDARTDVARAVYLALKDHFEPKDAVPTASDTAYLHARADILRQSALIDKLVDALAAPPHNLSELVSGPPGRTP